MHSLSGRTIAVTGAGSGIGRALALNLAQRGAKLALADKDDAGLLETSRLLGNYPHFAESFDVTDTAKLEAWVERSIAEFGALDGIIKWIDQPLFKFAEWGLVILLSAHLTGGVRLLLIEFSPWSGQRKNLIAGGLGVAFMTGLAFALALKF